MGAIEDFERQKAEAIARMGADKRLQDQSRAWFDESCRHRYSYHFTWLGRPIIQYPQDIIALQELIWGVEPEVIIETGIAHGGSLLLSASLLELLGGDRLVVGIDVDLRPHNREALESHALARRLRLIEGSSTDSAVVDQVAAIARGRRALVVLDSNHTHAHVSHELDLYSPFVRAGSYVVVFDTVIELMPADAFPDRPWGRGNNPMTAVREFLGRNDRFVVDREIHDKLQITVAPGGYLRCIKD